MWRHTSSSGRLRSCSGTPSHHTKARRKVQTDVRRFFGRKALVVIRYTPLKGDVYAFGIILYEIYGRKGPYGENMSPQKMANIVELVRNPEGIELTRPNLEELLNVDDAENQCPAFVIGTCWTTRTCRF